MRILVTGGAGFIASHVADAYVGLGHNVSILDDLSRGFERNLNAAATFYRGDIQDEEFVKYVFQRVKPEVVNHHAAQMDVRRAVHEPIFDARVNILGSINLLQAAVACGTRRIVYISTAGAAYGEPSKLPVSEDCAVNPITPYGITKHTVEHYLFTYRALYGLDYVVLRYGNVFGPRQNSKGEAGVFAVFSEQILAGIQPVIYGDGKKYRDYVFIEDAVRANVQALTLGTGEIFNIASGIPTTDYEVFCAVRDQIDPVLEPKFGQIRPGEIEKIILDVSKAARILNWSPRISLQEGASRTVDFFKRQSSLNLAAH